MNGRHCQKSRIELKEGKCLKLHLLIGEYGVWYGRKSGEGGPSGLCL